MEIRTNTDFTFLPFPSIAFLDGSLAHLPLLQELPDPMSSAVWSSWVEINMQTAERLGIRQGDLVEITSSQGSIRVPAFPSPGIAPDVDCDARRSRTRELHAICERAWGKSDQHSGAD